MSVYQSSWPDRGVEAAEDSIEKLESDFSRLSRVKELSDMPSRSSGGCQTQNGLSESLRHGRELGAVDAEARVVVGEVGRVGHRGAGFGMEFQAYGHGLDVEPA